MDAVRLVERGRRGDAVEEEGVEDGAVPLGQLGENGIEGGTVVRPEIGRRHHAGKEHRQTPLGKAGEQPVESVAGDRRVDAAKRIVGAELDDDGVGRLVDRPVDAGEAVARRVAGDAGIDDHHIVTAGTERRLETAGEGGAGVEAEPGGEAVAEGDDPDRIGGGRERRRRKRGKDRQHETQALDRHGRSTICGGAVSNHHHIGIGGVTGPIIACDRVHVRLGAGASAVHALDDVTLAVAAGTSLSLVGPSGSGKSTLLMAIAGLERPSEGRITIAGTDITSLGEDRLARLRGRAIGIVFQSFHLIRNMTALENVAVPLELAGAADAFDRAAAELEAIGLAGRMGHYPAELSGGEQQRVAIARALAPAPPILLADEPTGNLDAENGALIADLLFDAQARRGMTLVLVTHDSALAARSDRVVRLRSGRIEEGHEATSTRGGAGAVSLREAVLAEDS